MGKPSCHGDGRHRSADTRYRYDDGLAANAEAITELLGLFQRHKRAFAGQITGMAQKYIQRCEALGREPDAAMLAPVTEGLDELRADTPE